MEPDGHIGFIGLFTGQVATCFVERGARRRHTGLLDEQRDALRGRLDRLDELSPAEFVELQVSLSAMDEARETWRR